MNGILWAAFWFAVFGGVLGAALAIASKLLAVKTDPKIEQIRELLPGANCGGCGHSGCDAMAQAIAEGKADVSGCGACSEQAAQAICALMGVSQGTHRRMRAQVMCSGTTACAKEKYRYNGVRDCVCAAKLGGGTKECPNGCIGFGTCAARCPFDAITVVDGVAQVNAKKCTGCGTCVAACPKQIIRLIPCDTAYYVGCSSVDRGAQTRTYCTVGCIGCHLCEKNCPTGAAEVEGALASIDPERCIACGKCAQVCPRKIIHAGSAKPIAAENAEQAESAETEENA